MKFCPGSSWCSFFLKASFVFSNFSGFLFLSENRGSPDEQAPSWGHLVIHTHLDFCFYFFSSLFLIFIGVSCKKSGFLDENVSNSSLQCIEYLFHNPGNDKYSAQGCIFRLTCSYPELTKDHVLTSAYVNIFRTVTRNAAKKSV